MKKYLLFSLAITFAFVTRYYLLGKAPAGLYLDEAGQGYSAYSLLLTGKDEFGKTLPIVFRSFTDFKTPVYIYLIVPLIPLFGLSAFTVRFPSFIFSILTFLVLYLLIQELLPKKPISKHPLLAAIVSLMLAISPWHILFGRTNFECNVALFFMLSGILAFYKSLTKPRLLLVSAILLAIAIPAYHAQRVVTPLFVIILFLRFRKTLLSKTHFKYLFVGVVLGFLILLPTLSVASTPGFLARASLNIFSWEKQKPSGFSENSPAILNSPPLLSTVEFLSLYTSYFSPRNMFILGDYGPRSSFPGLSTFFVWQFPFYIYGLYLLVKRKDLGELKFFTIVFLLISPIPAAVTRDPYTTIRALQMVIPQLIIISLGLLSTWEKIRKTKLRVLSIVLFSFLIAYSLAKLYSSVIILNEYFRGRDWNYGWERAVEVLKNTNLPVVVDNSRDEPYIQLVFFLQYDPTKYASENLEVRPEEYYTNMFRNKEKHIGNIVTRPINWERDLLIEQYLVGDELAISLQQIKEHNLELIEEIDYPDTSPALRIVKTNPKFDPDNQ